MILQNDKRWTEVKSPQTKWIHFSWKKEINEFLANELIGEEFTR